MAGKRVEPAAGRSIIKKIQLKNCSPPAIETCRIGKVPSGTVDVVHLCLKSHI